MTAKPDPSPHLVIGTPCYGGSVTHRYMMSMLNLQAACIEAGIKLSFRILSGDALITRARNIIVEEFLAEADATHLLFIDADIGFTPDQVFRLLKADHDVVGAVYPIKRISCERIKFHLETTPGATLAGSLNYVVDFLDSGEVPLRDGFVRVRYLGNGFMMIRRGVFAKLAEHYPEMRYRDLHTIQNFSTETTIRHAFFDCIIDSETGVYLSEDYTFCKRWVDCGGEIWADLDSKLIHVGPTEFAGDFRTLFKDGPVGPS
jgi:glycosyltransferase involved in cell wall biosynthesis